MLALSLATASVIEPLPVVANAWTLRRPAGGQSRSSSMIRYLRHFCRHSSSRDTRRVLEVPFGCHHPAPAASPSVFHPSCHRPSTEAAPCPTPVAESQCPPAAQAQCELPGRPVLRVRLPA